MTVSRFIGLFILSLLCLPKVVWPAPDFRTIEAAKKERTVAYYTGLNLNAVQRLAGAFEQRYPFLKVEPARQGHVQVRTRILTESLAGAHRGSTRVTCRDGADSLEHERPSQRPHLSPSSPERPRRHGRRRSSRHERNQSERPPHKSRNRRDRMRRTLQYEALATVGAPERGPPRSRPAGFVRPDGSQPSRHDGVVAGEDGTYVGPPLAGGRAGRLRTSPVPTR